MLVKARDLQPGDKFLWAGKVRTVTLKHSDGNITYKFATRLHASQLVYKVIIDLGELPKLYDQVLIDDQVLTIIWTNKRNAYLSDGSIKTLGSLKRKVIC